MEKYASRALAALLLSSVVFAGCSSDGNRDDTGVSAATVTFSLNSNNAVFSDFVGFIRYSVPAITEDVVLNGAVAAFIRDREGMWLALPYTYGIESVNEPLVDYTVSLGYAYELRTVDVFVEASSSDDVVWDELLSDPLLGQAREVRIVIFRSFAAGKTGVDLTDYEALKRLYDLPE